MSAPNSPLDFRKGYRPKLLMQPKARLCSCRSTRRCSCLPRIGALFVAVALRPHWQTRMELRLRMASWLEAHPTWRATAHTGHCAAIHVRHGDKYTPAWLDREHPPPNVSLTDYVVKAKRALAHVGIVDTGAMMVMTDDADIIGDIPRVAARQGVTLYTVPSARPLASTTNVTSSKAATINCERSYRHPLCKHRPGFNYRVDPTTGRPVGPGELLQFLATWALMSHCPVLVGMHDSYFSHLIFHTMCAYRGACPAFINIAGKRTCDDDRACHVFDRDARLQRPCPRPTPPLRPPLRPTPALIPIPVPRPMPEPTHMPRPKPNPRPVSSLAAGSESQGPEARELPRCSQAAMRPTSDSRSLIFANGPMKRHGPVCFAGFDPFRNNTFLPAREEALPSSETVGAAVAALEAWRHLEATACLSACWQTTRKHNFGFGSHLSAVTLQSREIIANRRLPRAPSHAVWKSTRESGFSLDCRFLTDCMARL